LLASDEKKRRRKRRREIGSVVLFKLGEQGTQEGGKRKGK